MGKEDTKKALGLIGAILTVFVCAGWRIVGATKPAPAQAPTEAQASTVTTAEPAATEGPKEGEDKPIEVPSVFAMGSPEPFKWLVKPDHGRAVGPIPSLPPAMEGRLPMGPLTPLPAAGGKFQGTKEPEIRLTGVLPGTNAVAVVEMGSDSYVVRKGEQFGGGYTVDTIGTDRIGIVRDGKRTRLVLGE